MSASLGAPERLLRFAVGVERADADIAVETVFQRHKLAPLPRPLVPKRGGLGRASQQRANLGEGSGSAHAGR